MSVEIDEKAETLTTAEILATAKQIQKLTEQNRIMKEALELVLAIPPHPPDSDEGQAISAAREALQKVKALE